MTQTQPHVTSLVNIPYDPRYKHAAENAVDVCLRVEPGEHTTLITDMETLPIAASLAEELKLVGADLHPFVVEDYSARPMLHMPQPILDDLEQAQVSIYCMQALENELTTRKEMMKVINRVKPRHAHMVNISPEI